MKLKTKLTAAVLGVFASVFALCGTFSAISLKNYSLDTAASEEREKLAIAGRAFRQVGTREEMPIKNTSSAAATRMATP